jgi:hypothetical protein
MTWTQLATLALASLVVYLLVSLWALRRAYALECKVMHAHIRVLWGHVVTIEGNDLPDQELYEEMTRRGVKSDLAWLFSGCAAASDARDGEDEQ